MSKFYTMRAQIALKLILFMLLPAVGQAHPAVVEECEAPLQADSSVETPTRSTFKDSAPDQRAFERYFAELTDYVAHHDPRRPSPLVPHDALNRASPSQLEVLYRREDEILGDSFHPVLGSIKAGDVDPSPQVKPERRAKQLTGFLRLKGQTDHMTMEIPDGFIYRRDDGSVLLMGSGQNYIEYPSLDHLLKRLPGKRKAWDLRYPDGTKISGPYHTGELPWDLNIVNWNGVEVMYAGAMSPKRFREDGRPFDPSHADINVDNWSRSGHAFSKRIIDGQEVWMMHDRDLWGKKISAQETWMDHNYGRRVITDEDGKVWRDKEGHAWLVYDKVYDGTGGPRKTKIFARRMRNPYETFGEEIALVSEEDMALPGAQRGIGDGTWALVEGGNPFSVRFEGKLYYGLAASSDDFPTDKYKTLVAFREEGDDSTRGRIGPYQFWKAPNADGRMDLLDFAKQIREKHRISWGPGRPFFFADGRGEWWVLLHGIDLEVLPEGLDGTRWPQGKLIQKFLRNQYLFPVVFEKREGRLFPILKD